MRAWMLVAALGMAAGGGMAAQDNPDVPVPSRIEAVTVYLDRALVSRTASVQVAPGTRNLVFQGLPSEIEDGSLRMKLSGPARLESLQTRKTFLSERRPGAAQALEVEIRALGEQLQEQRDLLSALESAKGFIESVRVARSDRMSRELGREEGSGPDVEKYRAVLGFLTDGRVDVAARARKAQAAVAEMEPRLDAKRKELAQLKSDASLEQKEVTATLRAEQAGAVEVTLSYMLPGAMWFPAYDVRAEAAGDSAELACFAFVQQATGEDWQDASLTLSAARPAVQMTPPALRPWFLGPEGQVAEQTQSQRVDWDPCSNLNDQYGKRSQRNKQAHQVLLANAFQVKLVSESVEKRSSSAVFRVARREQVGSDGRPHRVTLAAGAVPLSRTYHAVPRQSQNTYVTGHLTNALGIPLLPGQASIFLGPDLVGSAAMPFVAPRETAEVALGVDEAVKVTRELDSRESGRSLFSSRKRLEMAYTVTVQNFRAGEAEVSVHEALPVSQDERIVVKAREIKPGPVDGERGLLRWDLRLAPGETREIRFAYSVEYPSDLAVPQVAEFERNVRQK